MALKILNNVDHKDLKVATRPDRRYGDYANCVAVLTTEYSDLHKQFPLLIHKSAESGELATHAILGLERDENLFIADGEWQTHYVPAMMARGPFSLGYKRGSDGSGEPADILIMVDEEDPRLAADDGESVFLEFGGETAYLEYIKKVLRSIQTGMQVDKAFFGLVEEMGLLVPASIRIALTSELAVDFKGYHTIDREKLAGLDADSLHKLNVSGVLGLLFFLISSLDNFEKMIELKNARSSST